jgi:hypothetical protein
MTRSALAVALLFVYACSDDQPTKAEKPVIESFTATPAMVMAGELVTLAWSVSGADTVEISASTGAVVLANAGASGTHAIAVVTNTAFTLRATNAQGTTLESAVVTASGSPDPRIDSLTVSAITARPNTEITIAWEATNTISVELSDGTVLLVADGEPDGSFVVRPELTTTYILTAKGTGTPATRVVTVTILEHGPEISRFTATPDEVTAGEMSTLSWTVIGAVEVVITDPNEAEVVRTTMLEGEVVVTPMAAAPPEDVIYRLTARDADGLTVLAPVTIHVSGGPQIVELAATPSIVSIGQTVLVNWLVRNAVATEISDGVNTVAWGPNPSGRFSVMPTRTTTYRLVARDADGLEASATTMITVITTPPPILAFDASPNPLALHGATTLSFETLTATSVRLFRDGMKIDETTDSSGTFSAVQDTAVAEYSLFASSILGTSTRRLTVYAHEQPALNVFTVEPAMLPVSGSVTATITWDVSNVATLDLLANGVPVPSFPRLDVLPLSTSARGQLFLVISAITDFTLIATSAAGVVNETISVR